MILQSLDCTYILSLISPCTPSLSWNICFPTTYTVPSLVLSVSWKKPFPEQPTMAVHNSALLLLFHFPSFKDSKHYEIFFTCLPCDSHEHSITTEVFPPVFCGPLRVPGTEEECICRITAMLKLMMMYLGMTKAL